MKKVFVIWSVLALLLSATHVFAQMGGGMMGEEKGQMKQQGMMDEGMMKQMMPMMEMCMPMMKQMMGEGMMKQDMMQMMMDMMNMQEKMIKGMKPGEKKKMMMKDMGQMKEKMQKMMSMPMGTMMGPGDPQGKLKCAETWLKKAIDLHEVHIKDPKTASEASQMELMDQMKKAYGCITVTDPEIKSAPPKEPAAGEKKKDAHGH